jgi:hypothetical protein
VEITGILTAGKYLSSALAQLGKPSPAQESVEGQALETPKTTGSAGAMPVLGEIVARYDVTDISPQEFSDMIRELHEAGALTDQQFQELAQIRVDLDLQKADPDEHLNLVDFCVERLREILQSTDQPGSPAAVSVSASQQPELASAERRLQWLEKFAAIQAGEEPMGLDAWA